MFYRLALTSSLMLASAIALDQAALAQSVDIPFNLEFRLSYAKRPSRAELIRDLAKL